MSGTIQETYLSDLHDQRTREDQSTLEAFGVSNNDESDNLGTVIAVVSDPTGGILDASDEFIQELGMPDEYLNALRVTRGEIDGEDGIEQHNRAVSELKLEEKYKSYLQNNDSAQSEVARLTSRIQDGETITIVCFEKPPKWCHRFVLKARIEDNLNKQ